MPFLHLLEIGQKKNLNIDHGARFNTFVGQIVTCFLSFSFTSGTNSYLGNPFAMYKIGSEGKLFVCNFDTFTQIKLPDDIVRGYQW